MAVRDIDCCDLIITTDKEKELMDQYKIADRDTLDFDKFYDLSLLLAKENDSSGQDGEALDYGTLHNCHAL